MQLLVGLGNPGAEYADTRHNIGFKVVEAIAKRYGDGRWRSDFHGVACKKTIEGEDVLLLLPRTYMNESGRAVAAAAKFHKLVLSDITVFHDDIERRPGNVKVKIGGGERGHNGLRSITAYVGKDYRRVQIGVGRPELNSLVESYVLSKLDPIERTWFNALAEIIAENVSFLLRKEDELFEANVMSAIKPLD
jgi:peptidyl-tRNA hydrolase, PTH1 family